MYETGATMLELHTGCYADADNEENQLKELARLRTAATYAHAKGLQVNAGHGLHYHNVQAIAEIPEIIELNIGHSIIARAVMTGLDLAVRDMKTLICNARINSVKAAR